MTASHASELPLLPTCTWPGTCAPAGRVAGACATRLQPAAMSATPAHRAGRPSSGRWSRLWSGLRGHWARAWAPRPRALVDLPDWLLDDMGAPPAVREEAAVRRSREDLARQWLRLGVPPSGPPW